MDFAPDPITKTETPKQARLSTFLERNQALMLGTFTLLYVVGHLCAAATVPMWVDELWTFYLAKTPDLRTILRAINDGIELNPPFSFLLAHASQLLFGASETATRLPAILGFWLMSVTLFLFVRRRVGTTCGYVAMLLPFFTFAKSYPIQARPYALVLGATSSALLFWQMSADGQARKYALPAFAVSIAALVSLHYNGLFVVVAIAAAEAVGKEKNRKHDAWFWVFLLVGCSPLVYLAPAMRKVHAGAAYFVLTPSLEALGSTYSDLIGPAAVAVFVVIVYATRPTLEQAWDRIFPADERSLRTREWYVGVNLLLMPFAAFMAAMAVTNAFMPRYVIPVVIGPAILVPALVKRIGAAYPGLPATVVCVLFGLFSLMQLQNVVGWVVSPAPAISVQRSDWTKTRTDLPLVIDDDNQFLRIAHYGTPAMQTQSYFLINHQFEIKHVGFDTPGRTMEIGARLAPLNVVDYARFVDQHRQFLLLRNSSLMLGWLSRQLLEEGAQIRLVQFEKQHGFRGSEVSIFLITMPTHSAASVIGPCLKPDSH